MTKGISYRTRRRILIRSHALRGSLIRSHALRGRRALMNTRSPSLHGHHWHTHPRPGSTPASSNPSSCAPTSHRGWSSHTSSVCDSSAVFFTNYWSTVPPGFRATVPTTLRWLKHRSVSAQFYLNLVSCRRNLQFSIHLNCRAWK